MKKIVHKNIKVGHPSALTLLEMVIAVAIVVVVFAAVLPQFTAILNSWDSKKGGAETLQNGRVLIDHFSRNLASALRIIAVSNSSETNGYIEFEDNEENILRYDIDASNYVAFGQAGNLFRFAGPVSSLQFTCYDGDDFTNPTTDVNSIRYVKVQAAFDNSAALGQEKTFTTSVYLRTNWESSSSGCGDPNLVGWWKLDEASGLVAADSSGYGNNGNLVNMTGNEWTDGVLGNALELDGSSNYVDCGNPARFDITGAITLSVWIKPYDCGDYEHNPYVGKSNQAYAIKQSKSGYIEFFIYDYTWHAARFPSDSSLNGQWHHLAGTYDGSQIKIYLDGELKDTVDYVCSIASTPYNVNIARCSEETDWLYEGVIDDVRIYNRALGPVEIGQLANALRYRGFTEARTSSDTTSLTISTPDTNEGDLLIAAVATDGDASSSLTSPGGEGWTEIDVSDFGAQVTLGTWWKLADASESSSHQFTWSPSEQAYGWVMRFAGHDPTDPINAWSAGSGFSSSPTSPSVTSTVSGCLILRLGAFDGDDITIDEPGLSGHTAITMDKTYSILLEDGFETDFDKWTDGGITDWDRVSAVVHSGSYSANCDTAENDLISDNLDTSGCSAITIEFWYYENRIDDDDDVYLQLYNDGSSYIDYFELGNSPQEKTWHYYTDTITDAQYLHSNFRIKFEGTSIDSGENLYIDDVTVTAACSGTVSGGAGYVTQEASGSSGTSNFSLGSASQAQMVTIAIEPANSSDCDDSNSIIQP